MGQFQGFVALGQNLALGQITKDPSQTPKDASAAPSVRVYAAAGGPVLTGTMSLRESGTVTGAANATPVVVTSAAHGLSTGQRVTVSGVGGNNGANGDFTVTVIDANSFSLNGSVGSGAYTSGGTWHAAGYYTYTVAATTANGFAPGKYDALVSYTVGGVAQADLHSFIIV